MTLLLPSLFGVALLASCVSTQDSLKSKYPYARLTSDYGILDENDLWISEQGARPRPYSEDSLAYPYWQCLESSAFSLSCKDLGVDEHEGAMADLKIQVAVSPIRHEIFGGRRGLPSSECNQFVEKFKQILKGERHVCVSGLSPHIENKVANGNQIQIRTWTFDRMKTRNGCVSYFEGYCDVNYWKNPSRM